MGGSIGLGMPLATGAAVACPDRKVVCLAGRRQRDVHAAGAVDAGARRARRRHGPLLAIRLSDLRGEFANVGAGKPGRKALDMLELDRPDLDFVALARGIGMGRSVDTADDFNKALAEALLNRGRG